ncbi:MAG TPA: hypothetical protein VF198_16470 [Vicinamibacterales bacterium]
MRSRPLSVTLTGWLFIAAGAVGLAYHAGDMTAGTAIRFEAVWVLLLRLLAVLIGIGLLRGARAARWLALLWLTYHVGLSVFHDAGELIAHVVLLALVAYLLFRRDAETFFRRARSAAGPLSPPA